MILLISLLLATALPLGVGGDWQTLIHDEGYCASYGVCGTNAKGTSLPCATNIPAPEIDTETAQLIAEECGLLWPHIKQTNTACCSKEALAITIQSVKQSEAIFNSCPACYTNFVHLWCSIACSPNQATFTDILAIETQPDTNQTVVFEANFYLSDNFKNNLFNSCKDVKLSVLNVEVLKLFFGDPKTANDWLRILGTSEIESGGLAPYTLNFPPENTVPENMQLLDDVIPNCSTLEYSCSCGDCPDAPYCNFAVSVDEEDRTASCFNITIFDWKPFCSDYIIAVIGLISIVILSICLFNKYGCCKNMYDTQAGDSENSYEPLSDGGNEFFVRFDPNERIIYAKIEQLLRNIFRKQGILVSSNPLKVLGACAILVIVCVLGLIHFQLEITPDGLWVPPNSRSAVEKRQYEESFGAFYRIESIVITTNQNTSSLSATAPGLSRIITKNNIELVFDIHEAIDKIKVPVELKNGQLVNVTLKDVCYKPLGDCIIESVAQYWQMDRNNWNRQLSISKPGLEDQTAILVAQHCFDYWTTDCYTDYYAPLDPKIVLGGYPVNENFTSYSQDATAFVITYLLDSSMENREMALAWEKAFIKAALTPIADITHTANLNMYFFAERSVQDELERESYADALTVGLSYLAMFLYIAIALSIAPKTFSSFSNFFINTRFVLALEGIVIVILAVLSALGLCSWLGIKSSLIIMEVIPFLILAVGVDNMFILANELHFLDPEMPLELRVGEALASVGPSITLGAFAEAIAFGLAAVTTVPAVKSFAICACLAIILDFILQVTAFTALLSLDVARIEASRADCVPCIRFPIEKEPEEYIVADSGTPSQSTSTQSDQTFLQVYITKFHIPCLVWPKFSLLRFLLLLLTVIFFFVCLGLMLHMDKGLEEQVALPKDSYLQGYYTEALKFLRVGAPVMFVVNGLNVTLPADQVNKVCAISGCNHDSLISQIDMAARDGHYYLASAASSWLDDFLMWCKLSQCCRIDPANNDFCIYKPTVTDSCEPCTVNYLTQFRPTLSEFQLFLPEFMDYIPTDNCARGGKGAYEDSIEHNLNNSLLITGLDEGLIKSSSFRSYYVPLVTQKDFISALTKNQEFVDKLKDSLELDIYAYSTFHVYFQSYLTIGREAALLICLAIACVFFVSWLLLGNIVAAFIIILCVSMTIVDLLGVSYLFNVQLNGVSVVNITMGVGIAVEFCVHITHAFVVLPGSKAARLARSLEGVGSSVISGITLTKFVGVVVLAFAQTQIFEIYYFRMYLALVLLGAWHGLVILPIFLGIFGPPSLPSKPMASDSPRNMENADNSTAKSSSVLI